MKIINVISLTLFLCSISVSKVIRVPKDYSTIQSAIDNALINDTIFIANGVYNEYIRINKSLSLIGEDKDSTRILYSLWPNQIPLHIDSSDGVAINSLTLGKTNPGYGATVVIEYCRDLLISDVKIIGAIGYPQSMRGEQGQIAISLLNSETVNFDGIEIIGGAGGAGIPTGGGFGGSQGTGGTALFAASSKQILLDSCTIRGGAGQPSGKSIEIQLNSNVTVLNSEVVGQYVYDSSSSMILQNISDVINHDGGIVRSFELMQNYPNPFNPFTKIHYTLFNRGHVILTVFDILGREIATLVNEVQSGGRHHVQFDASRLPSGIYVYRLSTANYAESKRMAFIK